MKYYLGKTEPEQDYSIDDLQKEGRTLWDNIHNALALRFISEMRPGDKMFIYHSQKQRQIVGLAEIDSDPFPNPDDPTSTWTVYVKFLEKFDRPVTLAEIKANPDCANWYLVRHSRLSTMPVPGNIAQWILDIAHGK